jgi:tetratricopeptide (TPR) repeat protein
MLDPLDRDVQDREPLENVRDRRSYPADWQRFRRQRSAGAQQLRDQLKKAQETEDKPAIIELSQRIVAIAPTDSGTWDTLAQTQLESEDLDDLERTLDAWQKAFKKPPAAIEDFRAGMCFKRKDYPCAEKHWLAFIATKPPRADLATTYDNLAEICAEQARWADHAAYRVKAIAAQDTAARRALHAVALLRLHNWDAAYADMAKANKMDATDSQVKEWLPEFERLQKFLPQIKTLDAQIAKSSNDPAVAGLLLERVRVFILAGAHCSRSMTPSAHSSCSPLRCERVLSLPKHCWMQGKRRTPQNWRSTGIFVVERTSMLAMRRYGNLERWTLVYQRIPRMQTRWLRGAKILRDLRQSHARPGGRECRAGDQ